MIKGGTALIGKGGTAVTRTIVTESEMAALIKRQQQIQQQQQKAGGASPAGPNLQGTQQQTTVQIGTASSTAGITTAQLLAQAGLQVSNVYICIGSVRAPQSLGMKRIREDLTTCLLLTRYKQRLLLVAKHKWLHWSRRSQHRPRWVEHPV